MSARQIKMPIGSVVLEAELLDTPTAEAIWNALPFTSTTNTRLLWCFSAKSRTILMT